MALESLLPLPPKGTLLPPLNLKKRRKNNRNNRLLFKNNGLLSFPQSVSDIFMSIYLYILCNVRWVKFSLCSNGQPFMILSLFLLLQRRLHKLDEAVESAKKLLQVRLDY